MTVYLNPSLNGDMRSEWRQVLDGVEFRLTVFWLDESVVVPFQTPPEPPPLTFGPPGIWMFSLAVLDGTPILAGQALRHGVDVLAGYRGDVRFPGRGFGRLLAWDVTGSGRNPGRNDLDPRSDVRLAYVPAAEAT